MLVNRITHLLANTVTQAKIAVNNMYVCESVSKEKFLQLSYRDLRQRTGIQISNWSKWFNGGISPTLDTLRKIANDLNMPFFELIEAFEERRSLTMQRSKEATIV